MCKLWYNLSINQITKENDMLDILKEFCCSEVTKGAVKYLRCAFDSFRTTKKVGLQCPFDLDRTEFAQVFAHFFSNNLALCLLKLFVSFSITTPLALALFDPPPVVYPVAYPILSALGYHLSSKVLDDLFCQSYY